MSIVAAVVALALPLVQPTPSIAASTTAPDPSPYQREIEAWRQKRLESLKADGGWLTVVGLHWLKPGKTSFGAAPGNDLVLPAHSVPAQAGVFTLDAGQVSVDVAPGVALTLRGQAVAKRVLLTDADGREPDILVLGAVRLQIIDRGGRLGVRVKDMRSEARRTFKGLKWYPVNPALRVVARFVPAAEPTTIEVPSVIGVTERMPSPGAAELEIGGKRLRLVPVLEAGESRLFFVFRDATSSRTTYGGGRFLYADPPRDGKIVLDFNQAYSPPCAFTPYATCPVPPAENRLPVPIEAGEMTPAGH
jgi:uncharacterized protein (DUF1684 family)